ncbi:MAG: hypothetical protein AAF630_17405 [Cyanobacteria bacterium P01_C01_bin.38]
MLASRSLLTIKLYLNLIFFPSPMPNAQCPTPNYRLPTTNPQFPNL